MKGMVGLQEDWDSWEESAQEKSEDVREMVARAAAYAMLF